MSLINDALKRASEAQAKAESTPAPEFKFRGVDPQEQPPRRVGWFFPSLIAAAAVLALLLLLNLTHRKEKETIGSKPPASVEKGSESLLGNEMKARAREDEPLPGAPLTAAKPVEAVQTESVAVVAVSGTTVQEVSKQPPTNSAAPAPEPSKPPGPKLQAIVFNPSRPSAIISGKTVFAGDRVGEWRVFSIRPDRATLVNAGETNVLKLGD